MRMLFVCLVVSVLCVAPARAEKAPMSEEELAKTATHIVTGKVQAIFSREEAAGDWKYMRYVCEVKVDAVEKGKGLTKGQLVYARYWKRRWVGAGRVPPSTSGHKGLPNAGDRMRVYMAKNAYDGFTRDNRDGGFNVIGGNGFGKLDQKTAAVSLPHGTYQASKQKDWFIVFKGDEGKLPTKYTILTYGRKSVAEGTVEIDGKKITLTEASGKLATKVDAQKTGQYIWSHVNGELMFIAVKDAHVGRRTTLTSNRWNLEK